MGLQTPALVTLLGIWESLLGISGTALSLRQDGQGVNAYSGADCMDLYTPNADVASCDTGGNAFNSLSGHLKA